VKIRENAPVSPEVVVAVLSLPTAVLAAAMSTWSARHVRRYETRMESEQKAQTKAEQAEAILSRYREPLLGAAHNQQSRLYNAVQNGFLARYLGGKDPERARYARDHTAYVLAESSPPGGMFCVPPAGCEPARCVGVSMGEWEVVRVAAYLAPPARHRTAATVTSYPSGEAV
jgi:hypothetical protein